MILIRVIRRRDSGGHQAQVDWTYLLLNLKKEHNQYK
jgi:hypothetical protein